jgi:hypothetical protein
VPGVAEIRGRSPLLVLEGEQGPPLSVWLAGYVISLLHQGLTTALEAAGRGAAAAGEWDRTIEYRVAWADGRFVSLLFSDTSSAGAGQRSTAYQAFLWMRGPEGWREATLNDLLLPGPESRLRLSDAVLAGLRAARAEWVAGGSIVELAEERLQVFTLTPRGMTLHFAPGEVGPEDQPGFDITLPVEGLQGTLRPDVLALMDRR